MMKHETNFVSVNSISVDADKLLTAVNAAILAVEKRTSHDVLKMVKIQAKGAHATVCGTNLDIEISADIDLIGESNTVCMFDAFSLQKVLKKAKGQTVTLSNDYQENHKRNSIHFAAQSHSINSQEDCDYPHLSGPGGDSIANITIPAITLLNALNAVKTAISTEETRYYLNGALFAKSETGIQLVTTNGHTLRNQKIECQAPAFEQVIVPRDTIKHLIKLLKNQSGNVAIQIVDSRVQFTFDNLTFVSKIVDGTYPDWIRLIPSNAIVNLIVDSTKFYAAVDNITLLAPKKSMKCALKMTSGKLALKYNSPESTSSDAIDADGSFDFEIGFNGQYLKEVMGDIGNGNANFAMQDSGSPALITSDKKGWLAILMPISL